MGTVAQERRKTKNQEKHVWLPASQSPRPSDCRPCLTDDQACGEGALPHLHAACLQRAHWPGNQPRLWSRTRLWTWPRSCLWPGLCQWCPYGRLEKRAKKGKKGKGLKCKLVPGGMRKVKAMEKKLKAISKDLKRFSRILGQFSPPEGGR